MKTSNEDCAGSAPPPQKKVTTSCVLGSHGDWAPSLYLWQNTHTGVKQNLLPQKWVTRLCPSLPSRDSPLHSGYGQQTARGKVTTPSLRGDHSKCRWAMRFQDPKWPAPSAMSSPPGPALRIHLRKKYALECCVEI